MSTFFIALAVVLAGGVLPLLLGKRLLLLRLAGVAGIGLGSLLGCIDSVRTLLDGAAHRASISYLHGFDLTFRSSPLAAFFLLAIFGISSVALATCPSLWTWASRDPRPEGG